MADAENPEDMVLYEEVERHIVRLTLNRPHRRNAILTPDMNDRLKVLLEQAQDDDDVKCVILAGAGKDFCSGEDVGRVPVETYGLKKGQRLPQSRRIRGMSRAQSQGANLLRCDKTVIAAVQGAAYGLGFNMALSCDLIMASEGAIFSRRQTRIGFAGFDMLLPARAAQARHQPGVRGDHDRPQGPGAGAEGLGRGDLGRARSRAGRRGAAVCQGGGQPLDRRPDDRAPGQEAVLGHARDVPVDGFHQHGPPAVHQPGVALDDEANLLKERARPATPGRRWTPCTSGGRTWASTEAPPPDQGARRGVTASMGADEVADSGPRAAGPKGDGLRDVPLDRFFHPRVVAMIGASATKGSATRLLWRTVKKKVEAEGGTVHPVNPRRDEIDGVPCFKSIGDIPGDIDLAVIAVGDPVTMLEEVVAKRPLFVMIFAAGFAEAGPEGERQQERLRQLVEANDVFLLGPNTTLNSFLPFRDELPGKRIALISHSGHQGRHLWQGQELGIPMSHWAPTGNEVDLEFADFVKYFAEQPEVGAIAGYIEGFKDGRTVILAADHAMRRGMPIVLVKVGRTGHGESTAMSHTAHLAGSDAVASAVLAQYGITRVDSMDELLHTSAMLARSPPPRADGVASTPSPVAPSPISPTWWRRPASACRSSRPTPRRSCGSGSPVISGCPTRWTAAAARAPTGGAARSSRRWSPTPTSAWSSSPSSPTPTT